MNKNNTRIKSAMNLGLILGSVLVILHLLFWFLKLDNNKFSGYLDFAVIIVCLAWGCKSYRDEEKGGIIRYSQSLGYGTLSAFFSSMIYAVYFFIFISYIDPEFLDRLLLLMEENLYTQGLSDEQIEFSLDIYESMRSPVLWSISSLLTITFLGFVASLVISIFIKKEGDPFDKTMSQINSGNKQS